MSLPALLPCCLQSAVSCCKNSKKEQQEQAKNGRRCRCSIWRDRCQLVAVCGSHLRTERNEEPPLSLNRRRRRRRQRFSSLCELLRCCCCWVGTPRPSCHSYSLHFEPPPPSSHLPPEKLARRGLTATSAERRLARCRRVPAQHALLDLLPDKLSGFITVAVRLATVVVHAACLCHCLCLCLPIHTGTSTSYAHTGNLPTIC